MWKKPRHKFLPAVVGPFFRAHCKVQYKMSFPKQKDFEEGSIILCNHTTVFDMFHITSLFRQPIYYMASIDLFEHAVIGKLLKYFFEPIPKEKSKKSDIAAIKGCVRVAKENGTLCIFPEGNRTFSGKLCYVDPSICKLITMLKKPLVLVTLTNGFGVDPRWGNKARRGKMKFTVEKTIPYDQYKDMSQDELYKLIVDTLSVDNFNKDVWVKSNKSAEYLERVTYVCPKCGKMHCLVSKGNYLNCTACGLSVRYNEDLTMSANWEGFPFTYLYEWYDWQIEKMFDFALSTTQPTFTDDVGLYHPRMFKKKQKIGKGKVKIFADRFEFALQKQVVTIPFDKIQAITMVGKKKMNIYFDGKTYQTFGDKRLNLIKYMHLFYTVKNKQEGLDYGSKGFMGL
ncbi:MAG: 1-acyl-sn-glycerol-3-phosphate acyltransferase [Clostridia bacterium]|nr:1-acyl-sn-glycerol-3-phosphate acyltransferase [Clostridia bacterium]